MEAYPDGVVVPLSTLRSGGHSRPAGQAGGVRLPLRQALGDGARWRAQAAGLPYDKHLAGGIIGWKAAGLPTKTGG